MYLHWNDQRSTELDEKQKVIQPVIFLEETNTNMADPDKNKTSDERL